MPLYPRLLGGPRKHLVPSASPAPLGEVLALSSLLGSLPQERISPPHSHLLTVEWGGLGLPLTCYVWPGGSWSTLASDIFDCCYLVNKLSRGGTYAFRTACVSKAGMGPYSSPSEQVLLGGPSHLGEPLQVLSGGCVPSRIVLPLHQNIYLLGRFVQVQGMRG